MNSTSPIYLSTEGIDPWHTISAAGDNSLHTITLVVREEQDLFNIVSPIFNNIEEQSNRVFRWYTTKTEFDGNKIQYIKQKKLFSAEIEGCKGMWISESPNCGVWFNVTELILPAFSERCMDYLYGGATVLLITDDLSITVQRVGEMLSPCVKEVSAEKIKNVLQMHDHITLAMFYSDSETNAAFQLFGKTDVVRSLLPDFAHINTVKVNSSEEVANFLNGD